jgi:hypothetical protein
MEEVTWLEVVHRRDGVVERRRIDGRPVLVGRGYAADLIVDDPQVCAAHLRIIRDEAGALAAEDLGSVNGTWVEGRDRVLRAVLRSGSALRIGQTELRFYGPAAAVAATEPAPVAGWTQLQAPRIVYPLVVAATLAATFNEYADDIGRVTTSALAGHGLGIGIVLIAYAGVWAFVSRVVARRFNFGAHLALAALASLALFGLGGLTSYVEFVLPDHTVLDLASGALWLAACAIIFGAHLAWASTLSRRRRLAVVGVLSGVVLAFIGIAALGDEDFAALPRFSAAIKPIGIEAAPTSSVESFVAEGEELRMEVDKLAKKRPSGH